MLSMGILRSFLSQFEKKYSKKMIACLLSIRIINLDSISTLCKPKKFIADFRKLINSIHICGKRMGGYVGESSGNYVLIVFLEDESKAFVERGCKAALNIKETTNKFHEVFSKKYNLFLKSTIGLHSGEVIVSNEIFNKGCELKALGENVNLATRIMEECDPDEEEILVSETALKFVNEKGLFSEKKSISINLPTLYPNINKLILYELKAKP